MFILNSSYTASIYDPKLKWKTIETPHFFVHFHQGEFEIAKLTANLSEEVHKKLCSFFQYQPNDKTHIILVDNRDIANAYATVFPQKTIVIYAVLPKGESLIGNFDNWIRTVLIHEYTHILQLDMTSGLPRIMRYIFGRAPLPFCFPNFFHPLWFIEGTAVLSETKFTTRGRGRAADWNMLLRTAILENKFLSIDKASGPLIEWPWVNSSYLYGNKFLEYLEKEYGKEKLIELNKKGSRTIIPYFTDWIFKKIYGKTTIKLWEEWKKKKEKDIIPLKKKISKNKEKIRIKQITKNGYFVFGPRFSPDGKKIAYSVLNPNSFPEIRIYDLENGRDYSLTDRYYGNYLCWTKDRKGLIFSQLEYYNNFYLFGDLFFFDLKSKKVKRLTEGLRLSAPDISPDGRRIVAIKTYQGINDLVIFDLESQKIKSITKNKDYIIYSSPSWSPDGSKIVVTEGKKGKWRVLILDLNGKIIFSHSEKEARIISPRWSPNGKFLIFSSDRTGIFNLYAYSLSKNKLYQITDSISGVFYPDISLDGSKLVFVIYSSHGYDLAIMDFSPQALMEPDPYNLNYPEYKFSLNKTKYPFRDYNPLLSLTPKFWLPIYLKENAGITPGLMTMGFDVLQKHYYLLNFYYNPYSEKFAYSINYIYDGLRPTFQLHLSRRKLKEDEKRFSVKIYYPFYKVKRVHSIFFEYFQEKTSYLNQRSKQISKFSGIKFGWYYNSSRKYGYSISRTDGRIIDFYYERDLKKLGSDYDISKLIGEWREYLGLPFRHHVLAFRIAGGVYYGKETKELIFIGGYKNRVTPFDSDYFSLLRGYEVGAFFGTKAILFNLEYRMPLFNIERGIWDIPIFLQRFHLGFFVDSGKAWNNKKFNFTGFKTGVGMEMRVDLNLGYIVPITLSVGIAKGLDKKFGKSQIYLRLGTSF
ncbi:hypothetical protein NLD30_00170 [SCandidatus Aminicenantes bacterium Aminicenantia_JdfR_composite]|jgi:Tol biopolymer transport system component|nr:hypothetical protein [SCandidatus Aminicenantes bacterium Aminicenantia_JdfR_composite]MCP2596960.1 hypothetical protein [Candidatus Aminicenantes bacterium AC-335-G13]MCP2605948.1 hypothetical protein [Candidatus Aminicenantes bacterium AC-708-I09]MCP2620392.1 hypothetical protein [Candidatus Aminicenantes bacterium AC-334-E05]